MSQIYHSLGLNMHQPLGNLIALHNSNERWEARIEAENALHQAVMTSRIRLVIPAHEPGSPVSVDFSPNGKRIVTASMDETVKVVGANMGQTLLILPGHYAAFSPNGKTIATILADGKVKVWDANSGTEITVAGQIEAITSISFSPDGKRLATVTKGNLPRIWDLKTGRELMSFPGHSDYVSFAYFSPDGSRILTVSEDGTARIWNAFTKSQQAQLNRC